MVSDTGRNRLYIASHDIATATVWDEVRRQVVATIPTGRKPVGVGMANDRVFVASNLDAMVTVINAADMTKMTDIKLNDPRSDFRCDGSPTNLAVHPGLNRVYVAMHGVGRVAVIDAVTNRMIDCISTNSGTDGVAVDPNRNRLYVTNRDGMDLQVFETSWTSTRMLQDIPLGGVPYYVTADPATGKVFTTVAFNSPDFDLANNLYIFNSNGSTLTLSTVTIIGNTYDGGHLLVSLANGMLYISATSDGVLQIFDPATGSIGFQMPLATPYGLAENRGLGRMYVGNRDINSISIVPDTLR